MTSDETAPRNEAGTEGGAARVDEAIAEYVQALDRGDAIPVAAWLDRHPDLRPRLERFLADRRMVEQWAVPSEARDVLAPSPERVHYFGDFELIRVLGQGGMGVVYLANQISLGRPVALKMIRSGRLAGEDELRRFRNEAEAVARLDHPNLLSIFEVGEHDGRRYFTMPLIGGGSLAEQPGRYRDNPRLAARLLVQVSEAIHHAHQRGILHRDLKPANVLVDETERPLVSDFGLSKRIDGAESSTGGLLGTPAYMAPEQASGRPGTVTTASDIYGLGAILYALLAGRPPFPTGSVIEVLRRVGEEPPERPSKLNRLVDRRLEAICLKCLGKDPRHRYPSALSLADDLRRWLDGKPVDARPARAATRLVLWSRRRPVTATLSVLLIGSISLGLAGIAWQWRTAEEQRRVADHQRRVAAQVDRYFRVAFLGFDDPLGLVAGGAGVDVAALERAASQVGGHFGDLPEVEAGIHDALGMAFRARGRPDLAEPELRRSIGLREFVPDPEPTSLLLARRELASLLIAQGRLAGGISLARMALDGLLRRFKKTDRPVLLAQSTVAQGELAAGRPREAERIIREILSLLGPSNDPNGRIAVMALGDLALALKADRRPVEAGQQLEVALGRAEAIRLPNDHPMMLNARNALAGFLIEHDRLDRADKILDDAIRGTPEDRRGDTSEPLTILANQAALRLKQARYPDAEAIAGRVIAGLERLIPASHPLLLNARSLRADARYMQGDWAGVVEEYDRIARDLPPGAAPDPALEVSQATQHADALIELGAAGRAVAVLNPLAIRSRPGTGAGAPDADPAAVARRRRLGQVLSTLGAALTASGRPADAELILWEAWTVRLGVLAPDDWRIANTEGLLGAALAEQLRFEPAEARLLASLAALDSPRVPGRFREKARRRLAQLYQLWGQPDLAGRYRDDGPPAR